MHRGQRDRADVIRLVARYVLLEFSMRSAAGRLAIHETRIGRKRGSEIDVASASDVEIFDALRLSELRRNIYRPAAAPIVRNDQGKRLLRVIAAKEVAPIVRGRSHHFGDSDGGNAREWRATIGQKLRRLPPDEAKALVLAEKIRIELRIVRNQLQAARSAAGRAKSGGRNARNIRRHVETRVSELRSREQFDSDRLKSLVRTRQHRDGIERLLIICTETAEIEAYCFGGLADGRRDG